MPYKERKVICYLSVLWEKIRDNDMTLAIICAIQIILNAINIIFRIDVLIIPMILLMIIAFKCG